MLNELINKYIEMFGYEPDVNNFFQLEEEEQIKILKECIEKNQELYENEYFNENYMEIVE